MTSPSKEPTASTNIDLASGSIEVEIPRYSPQVTEVMEQLYEACDSQLKHQDERVDVYATFIPRETLSSMGLWLPEGHLENDSMDMIRVGISCDSNGLHASYCEDLTPRTDPYDASYKNAEFGMLDCDEDPYVTMTRVGEGALGSVLTYLFECNPAIEQEILDSLAERLTS